MADKKVTTKTKKTTTAVEVKTVEQLNTELASKQTDLLQARRGNAQGELTNPHVITVTRKEIARLHTAIRAAEIKSLKENK